MPAATSLRTARFATATAEPAWHRRERNKRAAARALLRVQSVATLLAQHHSAQRMPAPEAQWVRHAAAHNFMLPGPRTPHWKCSCGFADNFACRIQCKSCNKPAGKKVKDAAILAANRSGESPKPKGRSSSAAASRSNQREAAKWNDTTLQRVVEKKLEQLLKPTASYLAAAQRAAEPPAAEPSPDAGPGADAPACDTSHC